MDAVPERDASIGFSVITEVAQGNASPKMATGPWEVSTRTLICPLVCPGVSMILILRLGAEDFRQRVETAL